LLRKLSTEGLLPVRPQMLGGFQGRGRGGPRRAQSLRHTCTPPNHRLPTWGVGEQELGVLGKGEAA
jgi:hypothetical protein